MRDSADDVPGVSDAAPPGDPGAAGEMLREASRLDGISADAGEQLTYITTMMKELSTLRDPNELVRIYGEHVRKLTAADSFVAISRRGVDAPLVRITRSSRWTDEIDPWKNEHRLPTLGHGLLSDLIYRGEPFVDNDFTPDPGDPSIEYLEGARSIMALPLYEDGESINMAVQIRNVPGAYPVEQLPGMMWMSNLFGRAAANMVHWTQVVEAQKAVQREVDNIAKMQRSLVTTDLPTGYGLDLAEDWQPSQQAGGDFFNVWPVGEGMLGLLIADVSGHGVAAAVFTAVAHAIVHTAAEPSRATERVMSYLNGHLCRLYTKTSGQFITAFYAVYDPATRTMQYTSAGHPAPRVVNGCGGDNYALEGGRNLPLGIVEDTQYTAATARLGQGDVLVFYTDGITEAPSPDGDLFGVERLEKVLGGCAPDVDDVIRRIKAAVNEHTNGAPAGDDCTLLVARVE